MSWGPFKGPRKKLGPRDLPLKWASSSTDLRSPPWNVWKTEWADFLSSKFPAKPLQVLYCLGLRHSAMVMGNFFCIGLERPKYFYIAADKAVYLKTNAMSVVSHRGTGRLCTTCVSRCTPGSWNSFLMGLAIQGARGKGLPCPGGWTSGPNCRSAPWFCLGWEPRAGLVALTFTVPVLVPATCTC